MQLEANELLAEFVATRSPDLREKLVLQSVPLVHYLLARMGISRETGSDYEDLAHQGLMGLMEAVDHFNPKFSTQFSTYASLRIRGKILDYLRTSDWMPRAARKRSRLIQKSISVLWTENQREPTEQELAAHLGTTVAEVQQGLADSSRILISLDTMMEADSAENSFLHECLRDEHQTDPSEGLEQKQLMEEIAKAIQLLPERQKLILSLYYNDELTFRQIGQVLHVTESRVCQLHARAMLNLKELVSHEQ
jgi:RNA polymerase sigma factor for flagellar operon FliA